MRSNRVGWISVLAVSLLIFTRAALGQYYNVDILTVSDGSTVVNPGGTIEVNSGVFFIGSSTPTITLASHSTTPGRLFLNGADVTSSASSAAQLLSSGAGALPGWVDLGGVQRAFTVVDSAAAVDLLVSARISNGAIRKSGTGLLKLTGVNDYAAGTTITGGTVEAQAGGLGVGAVTVQGSSTLNLRSDAATANFGNDLSANSATINIDRITAGSPGTFQMGRLTLGSSTLSVQGNGTLKFTGAATLNGLGQMNVSASTNLGGVIGGTGSLTKVGGGTLTLSGTAANTSTGEMRVNAGTMLLSKSAGINAVNTKVSAFTGGTVRWLTNDQVADSAAVVVNGSTSTLDLNGFSDTLGNVTMTGGTISSGAGTFRLGGDLSTSQSASTANIMGNISLNSGLRTFTVSDGSAANDLTVSANVSGFGQLIKVGTGTLVLSGGVAHTGGTVVSAGTLRMTGIASNFSMTTTDTAVGILSGTVSGQLDITTYGGSAVTVSSPPSGNISFNTSSTVSSTISANLGGGISLTKIGTGALILSGANSYSGGTTVTGGTLQGTTASLVGNISNSGVVVINQANDAVLAAQVSGGGDLVIAGTGAIEEQQSQAMTGTVRIDGGALKLTSSGSFANSTGYVIESGALLSAANNGNTINRFKDDSEMVLEGGTLSYDADKAAVNSVESIGELVVNAGLSEVAVLTSTANTSYFSAASMSRSTGAMVNFQRDSTVRIPGHSTGFIGSWALVGHSAFAKYDASRGVVALESDDYSNTFAANTHVRLTSSPASIGNISIKTLTLNTNSSSINVAQDNGTTLTLSQGGLLKVGSNNATISGGDLTSGVGELFVASYGAGTLRIGSRITGNVGLVTASDSQIILGNGAGDTTPNTYTGTTYVTAGELFLDKAANTLAIPGSIEITGGTVTYTRPGQISDDAIIILHQGGALDLNGSNDTVHSLINHGGTFTTGAGTLTVASPNTLWLDGGITKVSVGGAINSASLRVTNGNNVVEASGVMTINGQSTFDGPTNPMIAINSGASTGGKMVFNDNVIFTSGSGTASITTDALNPNPGTVDLGGIRSVSVSNGTADIDAAISARVINGTLLKSGGGRLQLAAANTYSGGTTISNGTIQATNLAALGSGPITFASGKLQLYVGSGVVGVGGVPLNINVQSSNTVDITVGTADSLSIPGPVHLGTATLGPALKVFGAAPSSLVFDGQVDLAQNISIENYADLTFSTKVHQTGAAVTVTKIGGGILTFGGSTANDYTGLTTVSAGELDLAKTASVNAIAGDLRINGPGTVKLLHAASIVDSSNVTLNGATSTPTLDLSGKDETIGSLSFIAGGTVSTVDPVNPSVSGTLRVNGEIKTTGASNTASIGGRLDMGTTTGTFNVQDDGSADVDLDVSAIVSGSAGLWKSGAGTLQLSGANTFTGGITVAGGRLITSVSAISAASSVTLAGGTIEVSGNLAIPVTVSANSSFSTGGKDMTLPSVAGSGNFTKTSTGTLTTDYVRVQALSVTGGTLKLASSSAASRVDSLTLPNGAKLDINTSALVVGSTTPIGSWTGSAYDGLTGMIQTARASGAWTGPGIGSSLATSDLITTVAVATATQANLANTTFRGVNVLSGDSVVLYTLAGDANLSGGIDADDYFRIDSGISGNLKGYYNGDFNYSGNIDADDYFMINRNYARTLALPAPASSGSVAAVPEPAGMILVAAAMLLSARRRTL